MLSSVHEEDEASCKLIHEEETLSDIDPDDKHVIILKAKPKDYLFSDSLHWVLSPTSGKLMITPNAERSKGDDEYEDEDEDEDEGDYKDIESEVFYSVKSCFSRCSSDEKEVGGHWKDVRTMSIWEEFCHCEGWPFGLFRRALVLPPLPNSPADSWTWSRKNQVTKVCTST